MRCIAGENLGEKGPDASACRAGVSVGRAAGTP